MADLPINGLTDAATIASGYTRLHNAVSFLFVFDGANWKRFDGAVHFNSAQPVQYATNLKLLSDNVLGVNTEYAAFPNLVDKFNKCSIKNGGTDSGFISLDGGHTDAYKLEPNGEFKIDHADSVAPDDLRVKAASSNTDFYIIYYVA